MQMIDGMGLESLAVDFDGTVVENKYPEIGEERVNATEVLRRLMVKGHKIAIWTCREDADLEQARDWLMERGVFPVLINANAQELIDHFDNDPRKVAADVYIDDHNLGPLYSWTEIGRAFCVVDELTITADELEAEMRTIWDETIAWLESVKDGQPKRTWQGSVGLAEYSHGMVYEHSRWNNHSEEQTAMMLKCLLGHVMGGWHLWRYPLDRVPDARESVLFNECLEMCHLKRADYSPGEDALLNLRRGGWRGVVERLGDKCSRLMTARAEEGLSYGAMNDAWLDTCNYTMFAIHLFREVRKELS